MAADAEREKNVKAKKETVQQFSMRIQKMEVILEQYKTEEEKRLMRRVRGLGLGLGEGLGLNKLRRKGGL